MLNFRGNSSGRRPPDFQAGPARRKLIYAVAIIGLAALLIKKGMEPWPQRQVYHGPADSLLPKAQAVEPVDGAFVVPPPEEQQEFTRKLFPGVREDFLTQVRDDNFFRPRESDAFFHLMKIVEDADETALEGASVGNITIAQFYEQPAGAQRDIVRLNTQVSPYRGEVVTIVGRLRQLQRVAAVPNEYDVEDYYQATIQPNDNPTFPVLVYLRRLPEGFSSQLAIPGEGQTAVEYYNDDVHLSGFFFKRLAYRAKDDIRTAPLVLARSFHWKPSSPAGMIEKNATWTFRTTAAGITVGVLLLILIATRSRGSMARWSQSIQTATEGDLRGLTGTEIGPSTEEQLRRLERESQGGPTAGTRPGA